MKSTRKIVVGIAAVASLGLAAAVYAQAGPGFGPGDGYCPGAGAGFSGGPMGGRGPGARGPAGNFDPAAMVGARLEYLKAALKINGSAQEAAWATYATQVTAQVNAMHELRTAAIKNNQLTAPERIAQRTAFMQQSLNSMQTIQGTVENLYGTLTPEQKAVADNLLGHPGNGLRRNARQF